MRVFHDDMRHILAPSSLFRIWLIAGCANSNAAFTTPDVKKGRMSRVKICTSRWECRRMFHFNPRCRLKRFFNERYFLMKILSDACFVWNLHAKWNRIHIYLTHPQAPQPTFRLLKKSKSLNPCFYHRFLSALLRAFHTIGPSQQCVTFNPHIREHFYVYA